MPDRKITLRRNNSGTSEAMYPTTTVDQIMASNGTTAAFDSSGKLEYAHLPDAVFGGLKFVGTVTDNGDYGNLSDVIIGSPAAGTITVSADLDAIADNGQDTYDTQNGLAAYEAEKDKWIGYYWVIAGSNSVVMEANEVTDASGYYGASAFEDGVAVSATGSAQLEPGDWLVISGWDETLNSGNGGFIFSVINNTYQNASNGSKGVVQLATNAETSTGTDTVKAVTPAGLASVLSGYSTTNTTYTTSAVDSGSNAIIRLTGSDSSAEDITLVAGDNIAITPSGDNITIDSSHPSISAANSVNNSGRTYIQDITLDSNGHITGITSATETVTNTDTNDYLDGITKSSNTLTFSVGSQSDVTYTFGANAFNSTTIPSVTLNGSANSSPNFYAPTASGTAGSSSASRQALFSNGNNNAPTFVDAPKIFYDTTTGWLHGDIVLDVD